MQIRDQTAQNVQSDLWSALSTFFIPDYKSSVSLSCNGSVFSANEKAWWIHLVVKKFCPLLDIGFYFQIYLNGRLIDNPEDNALEKQNIGQYMGQPCNMNPCLNGGVCVPKLEQSECKCPKRYIGLLCEKCKYWMIYWWASSILSWDRHLG